MKFLTVAACGAAMFCLSAVPVGAAQKDPPTMCERADKARAKVVKLHGKRAPGRDICEFGVRGKRGKLHAPSKGQKARYLRQLRKLASPAPYGTLVRTAVPPAHPPAGTLTPGVAAGGTLEAIAACESGGNPSAVSESGTYRGKYQFDYGTWASVGGSGDPAAASEAEQDMRAARLYAQRGAQPWPVCGR